MKDPTGRQSDEAFERVEPGSVEQCLGKSALLGQCRMRRLEGSRFCHSHGGEQTVARARKAATSAYNLTKYHHEVNQFANHEMIFSLRDEIGLVRVMIQELFNSCNGPADLVIHSSRLSQLIGQANKLVLDAQRSESQLGELLDRAAIQALADKIVSIISDVVPIEQMDRVVALVGGAIGEAVATRTKHE